MKDEVPFESLTRLSEGRLGLPALASVSEIVGGASVRRFFRVVWGDGRTAIAMYVPDSSPERVQAREAGRRWAFLEIRDLLADRGVRVPALRGEDCDAGWLLVEDLGSTLAAHLEQAPAERAELYQRAVRELARAQRALEPLPPGSIVRERAFDHALLRWEIDHFREWGLEARGIRLSVEDRAVFDAARAYLAGTIASLPRGFVHRDYQSRNLLVIQGEARLGWIDFQDALLGPRAYDLVALLSDSYQRFDRAFIDARLDEYAAECALSMAERGALGREFDLITVQRKLKDAGRFVYIERTKNDASFLRFIAPSVQKVRVALERLGGEGPLAALGELLERVVPEAREGV